MIQHNGAGVWVSIGTLTACCREGKQVHGYLTCPELSLQIPNPATC